MLSAVAGLHPFGHGYLSVRVTTQSAGVNAATAVVYLRRCSKGFHQFLILNSSEGKNLSPPLPPPGFSIWP